MENFNMDIGLKEWQELLKGSLKIASALESLKIPLEEPLLTKNQFKKFKKCANTFVPDANELSKFRRDYPCNMRICPYCKKKQNLMSQYYLLDIINYFKKNISDIRFLTVKLSIKTQKDKIEDNINLLNSSFRHIVSLSRRKALRKKMKEFVNKCYLGYYKTLEVTYNEKDKQYYIILRSVFAIKQNYIYEDRYYVNTNKWKKCFQFELKDSIISDLKIDYTNKNNDITYDFLEEYTKCAFDLTPIMRMKEKKEIVDVLRTYINILHRRHKFVSTGGIFRIN